VPIKRSPGCGCCGVPTFTCAALSCNIPATIYVTDPVYGVTATLTKTGSTWNGNATISFPGYFVNSSCLHRRHHADVRGPAQLHL
jgi:hypothetical protein